VTLTRYQEFNGPHEPFQEPTESDYWFEFKNPDTGELVRWSHDRNLGTVALMVERHAPFLLVMPWFGSSVRAFNCPDPPYLLFKFVDGQWQRLPLKEMPVSLIRSNMTSAGYEARKRTDSDGNHLSIDVTQASVVLNEKPWLMDFSRFKEQSFGDNNCHRQSNYLLVSPGINGVAQ
jgi:hypothetical protein